jgi:hypothetical protein
MTQTKPKPQMPVRSTRLLACPWCGETPAVVGPYAAPSFVRILCRCGDCTVNPSVSGYTYESAVSKWNKRKANEKVSESARQPRA